MVEEVFLQDMGGFVIAAANGKIEDQRRKGPIGRQRRIDLRIQQGALTARQQVQVKSGAFRRHGVPSSQAICLRRPSARGMSGMRTPDWRSFVRS